MGIFKKPVRSVHTTFIHCSASDNPNHDDVSVMDTWHKDRGWSGVGYHYFIRKDGTIQRGRHVERVGAHVAGHNTGSIGICCHGLERSQFTAAQFRSLRTLCAEINEAYGGKMRFRGHNEVAAKACPVFDYRAVLDLDAAGRLGAAVDRPAVPSTAIPSDPNAADAVFPELDEGDQGAAVRQLQTLLNNAGAFMGIRLKVDGLFGPATAEAVQEIKREYGLYPSPLVEPHVWRTLLAAGEPRAEVRNIFDYTADGADKPEFMSVKTDDDGIRFDVRSSPAAGGGSGSIVLSRLQAVELYRALLLELKPTTAA